MTLFVYNLYATDSEVYEVKPLKGPRHSQSSYVDIERGHATHALPLAVAGCSGLMNPTAIVTRLLAIIFLGGGAVRSCSSLVASCTGWPRPCRRAPRGRVHAVQSPYPGTRWT
eukprot:SAG11_NODE_3430_length_2451_cov_1.846939_4_plen_113_part_00